MHVSPSAASAATNAFRMRLASLLLRSTAQCARSDWQTRNFSQTRACLAEQIRWPDVPSPNPYQIFHLSHASKVDPNDLKRKYYGLVKQYHPDTAKVGDSDAAKSADRIIRDRFNRIVDAYEILSNPSKKKSYDMTGFGWNYPDPARANLKPHERYNYTKAEWDRMRDFTNDRMWASGQYPDEKGNPPDPPKPRPVDHEANMRTLLYIILFTCGVTYIQSLRALAWADGFDEQVKQRYLDDNGSTSRVFAKYSGTAAANLAYDDIALARPQGHGGHDHIPSRDPIPSLRALRSRMRDRAASEGIDVNSEQFKEIDDRFVVTIGKALQGRRVAHDIIPTASKLCDDLLAECIQRCKK